jgi:hypothetical protein
MNPAQRRKSELASQNSNKNKNRTNGAALVVVPSALKNSDGSNNINLVVGPLGSGQQMRRRSSALIDLVPAGVAARSESGHRLTTSPTSATTNGKKGGQQQQKRKGSKEQEQNTNEKRRSSVLVVAPKKNEAFSDANIFGSAVPSGVYTNKNKQEEIFSSSSSSSEENVDDEDEFDEEKEKKMISDCSKRIQQTFLKAQAKKMSLGINKSDTEKLKESYDLHKNRVSLNKTEKN